ncbi:hypothetical protein TREES_T100016649 [Tupaia chinensis]|uniref:Uncharacterized protein n=1 Tax=Tupaia chinensis TaxID=246437 RepID=L9L717_TUPCH|nr:hypothetical protein TREES_T100016649 [Tupaia chinensis]
MPRKAKGDRRKEVRMGAGERLHVSLAIEVSTSSVKRAAKLPGVKGPWMCTSPEEQDEPHAQYCGNEDPTVNCRVSQAFRTSGLPEKRFGVYVSKVADPTSCPGSPTRARPASCGSLRMELSMPWHSLFGCRNPSRAALSLCASHIRDAVRLKQRHPPSLPGVPALFLSSLTHPHLTDMHPAFISLFRQNLQSALYTDAEPG